MYGLSKWEIVYHSSPQTHTLFHIEIKDTTTTERNYFDLDETRVQEIAKGERKKHRWRKGFYSCSTQSTILHHKDTTWSN